MTADEATVTRLVSPSLICRQFNNTPGTIFRRRYGVLMHLPTLGDLDLRWIVGFPISNLLACSNIKHLRTRGLNITGENDDAADSTSAV